MVLSVILLCGIFILRYSEIHFNYSIYVRSTGPFDLNSVYSYGMKVRGSWSVSVIQPEAYERLDTALPMLKLLGKINSPRRAMKDSLLSITYYYRCLT